MKEKFSDILKDKADLLLLTLLRVTNIMGIKITAIKIIMIILMAVTKVRYGNIL